MFVSDPIADMITRIRNAQSRLKPTVEVPFSKYKSEILDVLQREGYIKGYRKIEKVIKKSAKPYFCIDLKYYNQQPVIQMIKRISKPSVSYFSSVRNLSLVANGLGISVLTTSKGVMSDREARENHVGGQILIQVK